VGALLVGKFGEDPSRQAAKLEVVTLEGPSLFGGVLAPGSGPGNAAIRGANGRDTAWAVFFHKPYCGACRRVRPFFHALARTTNATAHLRFGEVDCVKWRPACSHAGAKAQPTIKLYSVPVEDEAAPKKKQQPHRRGTPTFTRREVASWRGVLVAYEIFDWFLEVQAAGLVNETIAWPSDDALAAEMRAFKLSAGDHRVETVAKLGGKRRKRTPRAYLEGVDRAWRFGLHDAVFERSDRLEGERLQAMADWLQALSYALPRARWRARAKAVLDALVDASRPSFSRAAFGAILRRHGVDEPTDDWAAVAPACPAGADGATRYPSSLWLLFHTLLANSDRHAAPHVLRAIRGWVVEFFGCTDCAAHFDAMWRADDVDVDVDEASSSSSGGVARDAFSANLWLWRAHNDVASRLFGQDGDGGRFVAWPDNATCAPCFARNHHPTEEDRADDDATSKKTKEKNGAQRLAADVAETTTTPQYGASSSSSSSWGLDEYDQGYVFQFLAETYCFDSDTFACAAFDDPSRGKKHRRLDDGALTEDASSQT